MALSRPLLVALVAGALLVVSIGVDVAMNRSWTVDVQTPNGWRTIGQAGPQPTSPPTRADFGALNVSRNDSVHLRVTIDNGYLWSYSSTYRVLVNGAEVTRGTLVAPARGSGVSEFDVPARLAYSAPGVTPVDGGKPVPVGSLSLEVVVGGADIYAYVPLQEGSA